MSTPLSSFRASSAAKALALIALSLALTGCSDVLTFAQQNRDIGMAAYREADYPKAAGAFRSALRQDPRDYISHYYLGLSSLQLHNYQQAVVAFRSCLETQNVTLAGKEDNATRLKALEGLARAIVKSDDSDQEVNRVEQEARGAKGSLAAREFFLLGKVYRYRMLPDMALDYYNRATLDDPKNFDYAKEYALYCEQLQQTQRAQEALRKAYTLNSSDKEVADALRRLGVVPGLSLMEKDDLAKPMIPLGPIPELDMAKVKSSLGIGGNNSNATGPDATPASSRTPAVLTPRD
jgi:tetratricopeptide (TPR) repeat protein